MTMTKLLVLLLWCCCASQASAQTKDWESQWNELIAAARKEGKVVIFAPPDQEVRQALPAVFKARFGVTLEYLGGRSNESSAKLRTERQAGIYSVDATLSGVQTMATTFYREKMLDPLAPVLILPEVVDGSKWKKGKPWFVDPEGIYVLRLFNSVDTTFHLNTSLVKPDDLKFARDLLDPKWKGKIAIHDPTVAGAGSNMAARLYAQFGEDFIKRLYVDQKPVRSADRRQVTDWLAHGAYPIAFGAETDQVERLRRDGLPIISVHSMPDLPGSVSAGVGEVALLNHAPHPNAAKLFVNWIASKEGLETFARARGEAPTRNDIDEASFLRAEIIPHPGEEYFDTFGWDFTITTKEEVRLRMKELMRGQ